MPLEVKKIERIKFIAIKTDDGKRKGKIAFYCKTLNVSKQGFYKYFRNRKRPWNYQRLANVMLEMLEEDECNDTYGRKRMYAALLLEKT